MGKTLNNLSLASLRYTKLCRLVQLGGSSLTKLLCEKSRTVGSRLTLCRGG